MIKVIGLASALLLGTLAVSAFAEGVKKMPVHFCSPAYEGFSLYAPDELGLRAQDDVEFGCYSKEHPSPEDRSRTQSAFFGFAKSRNRGVLVNAKIAKDEAVFIDDSLEDPVQMLRAVAGDYYPPDWHHNFEGTYDSSETSYSVANAATGEKAEVPGTDIWAWLTIVNPDGRKYAYQLYTFVTPWKPGWRLYLSYYAPIAGDGAFPGSPDKKTFRGLAFNGTYLSLACWKVHDCAGTPFAGIPDFGHTVATN